MNDDFTQDPDFPADSDAPRAERPLGYWLRLVDGLISREFATAFEGDGVTRRDWMLLNALSGDIDAPGITERLARKGGKRLRRLEQLRWAEEQGDGSWALTDAGREAKDRLGAAVGGIRERVAGAVSPEDYATMVASLEAIATELGWDASQPFPRGAGFGRGRFGGPFRPGFGRGLDGPEGFGPGGFGPGGFGPGGFGAGGFGPGDFGHGHGFGPGHAMHEHWHHGHAEHPAHTPHAHRGHEHRGHEHRGHSQPERSHRGHGRRKAERAYERGFAAGFGAAQSHGDPAPAAAPAPADETVTSTQQG